MECRRTLESVTGTKRPDRGKGRCRTGPVDGERLTPEDDQLSGDEAR
jgi:hypothetical protein